MRSFWSQVAEPNDAAAAALDGLPKQVVSSTLQDPGWNGRPCWTAIPWRTRPGAKEQPGGEA